MYLGRKKKIPAYRQWQPTRGVRPSEINNSNNSTDTKLSEEGGGGRAPGARADIPLQHVEEDHGEAGCSSAAHGGPQRSRYPLADCGGPHVGAGGCPKQAVTLWRTHSGAGSWQDLWACEGRTPHRSRFAGRTCDPVGDPYWSSLFLRACTPWKGHTLEQFVKNCSPWEGPTLEQLMQNCVLWEGPHAGAGQEAAAETMCEELTATPISRPPVPLRGRRQRKLGVKLSPGRREG